jgi:hypothetical protein
MFSAFAAGTCSTGISRGITALRVGWFTARNADWTANSASTTHTLPTPPAAQTQSASDVSAMPEPVTSRSSRRSTASAMAPPQSPKTTSGTSPKSPVRPT